MKPKSPEKITPKNTVWTEPELRKAAKQFKTRRRFFEGNPGAYRTALRRGLMDVVCAHMKPVKNGRPKSEPLAKSKVLKDAASFTLMKDLMSERPDIMRAARQHGMEDDVRKVVKRERKAMGL